MTGKAPKLSEFGEVAEAAFRERDVFVGQPAKRRELIASIEAQGMTADEFRLVMRWWGRQTGFSTPKALLDVLGSEVNWRDVAANERPRRDKEESRRIEESHYPGMPRDRYEPNPIIRELRRLPPFTDADAVDAYRAGLGMNLWSLACHLGWSDDAEFRDHRVSGKEPAGVTKLRKVLKAAGIDLAPWSWIPTKPPRTKAQRAEDARKAERHEKALALMRVRAGKSRPGDADLIAGWDPQSEVEA